MTRQMVVVATNRGTWGKGLSEIEALFNALRIDSSATIINVITITDIPEEVDSLWPSCGVQDDGRVYYPKGATVSQRSLKPPTWMNRKFSEVYSEMQDLLQDEKYLVKVEKKNG